MYSLQKIEEYNAINAKTIYKYRQILLYQLYIIIDMFKFKHLNN